MNDSRRCHLGQRYWKVTLCEEKTNPPPATLTLKSKEAVMEGEWQSDGMDLGDNASWIANRSAKSNSTVIKLNVTGGSPMNLAYQWANPRPPPTYYCLRVTVTKLIHRSSSLSVGVVRTEEFKKGYGVKGMFYNGNLTNGSAALKVGYGPHLKTDDEVIVEYREIHEEKKIDVKVYVNGNCLGTAFQVRLPSSSFRPCLHAKGAMQLQVQVLGQLPEVTSHPEHPLASQWSLVHARDSKHPQTPVWPLEVIEDGTENEEFPNNPIILSTEPLPNNVWRFSLKICNSFVIQMSLAEEENDGGAVGEVLVYRLEANSSSMISTKMMPMPPMDLVESRLPRSMQKEWQELHLRPSQNILQAVRLDDDEDVSSVLAQWERVKRPKDAIACTSYRS